MFFWENLSSPQSVSHYTNVGQGRSGGSIPPGPLSLGKSFSWVWTCVSWIWRACGVRHNFGTLTPSPIFPKICHYFGTFTCIRLPKTKEWFFGVFLAIVYFHPEPNFPKNLPQLWDFSRIQILGTFVLRFRYFEFTACDCRSLEFTIGPTDISSLLVVGTSVFLVPLTLHWKKLAEWSYTTKPIAYFHMATHLVMLTLWRCPRCRPHGCSLLRPKNCKPQSVTACPQFITTNITICLYTNHFGEQLSVATFGSSFREPLFRIALGRRFRV